MDKTFYVDKEGDVRPIEDVMVLTDNGYMYEESDDPRTYMDASERLVPDCEKRNTVTADTNERRAAEYKLAQKYYKIMRDLISECNKIATACKKRCAEEKKTHFDGAIDCIYMLNEFLGRKITAKEARTLVWKLSCDPKINDDGFRKTTIFLDGIRRQRWKDEIAILKETGEIKSPIDIDKYLK